MTELLIRAVASHDVAAVAALRTELEEGGASAERMSRYLAGEHHPQFALPPRGMWAADVGGAPVAFIAGHLSRRFDCDGELQWLYVVPVRRRTGIASQLLFRLATWFASSGAQRVCVNASAPPARTFYARHGATEVDAHWMVWEDIGAVQRGGGPAAPC
jgi:GNAT superfamily N-acetyltransferase